MEILKVMILAVLAVLICGYLKNCASIFHMYVSLAACILIMLSTVLKLSSVAESFAQFSNYLKYSSEYAGIVFKVIIITYVTAFTSDICKDAGYSAIASQIELFGKISIIIISIPVIFELLDLTVVQTFGADMQVTAEYDYSTIDEALSDSGFFDYSFGEIVSMIINDDFSLTAFIKSGVYSILSDINTYRQTIVNILMLAAFSGVFKLLTVHNSIDSYSTSRLILLINLIMILSKIYGNSLSVCIDTISDSVSVYVSIVPVFMSAVAVVTGNVTYAAYYQVVLLGITVVNIIFVNVLTKLIRADYYLLIMNKLSQTNRFGKLSQLLESIVKWTCKGMIIAFTGMGCIKGIMAPMSDSLKKQILYKSAKLIPGLGDSLDAVSSVLYGSGIIIKNGIGIGGIVILIITIGAPLMQIAMNFILLKVTSALLEPMADNVLIQIMDGVAGIIGLMMLLVAVTGILFIVMIGLICASTNNIA